MSDDDQDQDLKEDDDEDDLTELQGPSDGGKSESRKSGNVKFSENLNKVDDLEKQYAELMNDPSRIDDYDEDNEDGPAPDLVDAAPPPPVPVPVPVKIPDAPPPPPADPEPEPEPISAPVPEPEPEPVSVPTTRPNSVPQDSTAATSLSTVGPSKEPLSPEDIFNEIKVAKGEIEDQDGSQTIHSFIIAKSFSSENVVVLLNLRRMKDGEWVLDKTIAQGLKSETYGGVVSIDQYEFSDPPPGPSAVPVQSRKSTAPKESRKTEEEEISGNNRDIMEILRKLQEQVNQVNQEIEEARKAAKNIPPCRPCNENDNVEEAEPEDVSFENLSFLNKLRKLLDVFISVDDDPCSCCTEENPEALNVNTVIKDWVNSAMKDMSGFYPFSYFIPGAPGSMNASEAAALISQSAELMEEAAKSGLMDKINPEVSKTSTDRSSLSFGKAEEDPFDNEEIKLQKATENLNFNNSFEMNIESNADVQDFIREHANEDQEVE